MNDVSDRLVLTPEEGVAWPDPAGEALAAATLREGGTVALAFATLADAVAFVQELERRGHDA